MNPYGVIIIPFRLLVEHGGQTDPPLPDSVLENADPVSLPPVRVASVTHPKAMSDHDSRDVEPPARADASAADYPSKDGRRAWIELTGFQRDCLEAVARRERDGKSCYPSGIAWTLEHWYPAVSRARLEPNLRALVGRGLLSKRDDQGVTYRLTDAGRALLLQRAERLAGLYERRLEPIDGVAREKPSG